MASNEKLRISNKHKAQKHKSKRDLPDGKTDLRIEAEKAQQQWLERNGSIRRLPAIAKSEDSTLSDSQKLRPRAVGSFRPPKK